MFDVCILGKGPAGLSAGIYAVRAGAKTLVIGGADGALAKAKRIDNYFGIATIGGRELLEAGEAQYKALGGETLEAEATAVEMIPGGYLVHTADRQIETRALVLAMGKARKAASLPGETEFLGKGVSHCAVCDGFFFKKKRVGVLGAGAYAASEAQQLLAFTPDVTVFTDGKEPAVEMPCPVETAKLAALTGELRLGAVQTADGTTFPLDGFFIARGSAGASELALKLGVPTDNGNIRVDKDGMTALPGVFAAGDCLGGLCQVSVSVGTGALAGQRAAEYVRRQAVR
ncbi:MAG: NAD(P)/FAD-dependent oxidoreductase [Clostridia bacterium]|nr:NAD(P)/FAD-dependent oxidoreductase [Clostridia bacterium]